MPLYMDLHKIPAITVGNALVAHAADEKLQKKYGVKYLQFWVNEQAGTLFCLVEGPDKSTVETVHRLAHGHIACAMVEVDPSYYSLIMGVKFQIDNGLVRNQEGAVDLGYRSIMAITLQGKPSAKLKNYEVVFSPSTAQDAVMTEIRKFSGRPIKLSGDDIIVTVFDSPSVALKCAKKIQMVLSKPGKQKATAQLASFSIGLSSGQPVTENNEFIEDTIRLAKGLSFVAGNGTIFISSLMQELAEHKSTEKNRKIRSLISSEETFMISLLEFLDKHVSDEDFNIASLVREMGISRPQLYRKIQTLTGKAPNDLVRDVRLSKALSMLKRKSGNISEIAFEVGFSNPSYFSKCFFEKFGCLPSQLS